MIFNCVVVLAAFRCPSLRRAPRTRSSIPSRFPLHRYPGRGGHCGSLKTWAFRKVWARGQSGLYRLRGYVGQRSARRQRRHYRRFGVLRCRGGGARRADRDYRQSWPHRLQADRPPLDYHGSGLAAKLSAQAGSAQAPITLCNACCPNWG